MHWVPLTTRQRAPTYSKQIPLHQNHWYQCWNVHLPRPPTYNEQFSLHLFARSKRGHKEIFFDIMFTLLRTNSTQINTSRQCMLNTIHVTSEWNVSHGLMVIATSSVFVSDVVTLCFCWLVSTSKAVTLCFWLPKIILLPTYFYLNFSICTVLFLLPTNVDKYFQSCIWTILSKQVITQTICSHFINNLNIFYSLFLSVSMSLTLKIWFLNKYLWIFN